MQNLRQNFCKVSCQKLPENRKAYVVGVFEQKQRSSDPNCDFLKICTTVLCFNTGMVLVILERKAKHFLIGVLRLEISAVSTN